jgi:hypothetical protein
MIPIEESELTSAEIAALPDEAVDELAHEEALLVEGPAEDDAALFDNAYAVASFDEPVIDDGEAAGVAGTRRRRCCCSSGGCIRARRTRCGRRAWRRGASCRRSGMRRRRRACTWPTAA